MAAIAGTIGAVNMLTGALGGAVSRYDTLNSFPRVLQLMGFDAADSEAAINKLSDGIDGLPTTLDSVASTAQRIALMTGDLDGAVDTTLALNNAFLASGASTADAARGLEQYVQMMAAGTVDLQSWRTLQETMPVALNKVAEAFGYTGRSAQNDLYEALKEGEITFDEFNAKLIELSNATGGFADMARESSTGIATSWQNVQTAVVKGLADMIAAIDEGLSSFGGISGVFDSLKAGVNSFFNTVNALIPVLISGFLSFINVLRPLTPLILGIATAFVSFNMVLGIVNSVKNAITTLRAAFVLLNATMLANPVALVIAVLAGLAAMFIYLWQTSETFRNGVTNAFNALLEIVMPIVQAVVDFVMQVWGMLVQWWNENSQQILTIAQTIWQTVYSTISEVVSSVVSFVMDIWSQLVAFWNQHGQMILQAAQNVWSVISTVITTATKIIWSVIQTMAQIVWSIMQALWPIVKGLVIETWEAIKGTIQGAVDVITGIIQFFAALFTGDWSALWDAVKQILSGAVQFIGSIFQLWFVGRILKIAKTFAKSFRTGIGKLWDKVKEIFSKALEFIGGKVSSGFSKVKNVVTKVMSSVRSFISSAWSHIKETINVSMQGIRNIISNIWNGIKNIISKVLSGIKTGISKAWNGIKNIVSKTLNAIKNIVASVWNGIKSIIVSVMNGINNVVSRVWNAIFSIISSILSKIKSTISRIFNSFGSVVSNAFNRVRSAVRSGMNNAYNIVKGFFSKFKNAGKNIVNSIANGIKGAIGAVTDAIGNVTQKIRNFLPFSPAKEGALRDIMDIQIAESIAKSIDKGRRVAVTSMAGLTDAIYGEMPQIDIAGQINSLHAQSQRQMAYDYQNELTVNKQPAYINLVLGGQEFNAFVDDITTVQDRKTRVKRAFV